MTENQNTPSNSGEGTPSSPEQVTDQNQQAIEALAKSHDEIEQRLSDRDRELAEVRQQMAELQRQLESRGDGSTAAQTETTDSSAPQTTPEQPVSYSPEKEKEESKPDIQRDLERIAQATGRSVDDPDVKKLLVREKAAQFAKLSQAYEDQSGTVRQEGFMQDVATAKREFEEALYLYDPKFAEMDAQYDRTKAIYDRTTDPDEKARLRQELFRLKDHGSVGDGNEDRPGGSPRRDAADALLARVGDIARSLEGTEILATYELNKGEYPEDPISSRRRTDTKDWRGKPEFENGIYVGSSPERTGEWVIEPKAPIEALEKEVKDTPPVGESQGVGEVSPAEGAEAQGASPEARVKGEVPIVDPGQYPELYARRKNLSGGDVEKLLAESKRVSAEITARAQARIENYKAENPDATPEEITQMAKSIYVEERLQMDEKIIAAVDGVGYKDAAGNVVGRSATRRFGAWMDRNGSKLKKAMMYTGLAGLVVLGGGLAVGAIGWSFAIGAGTAIGAAKGAAVGLTMSRQGSKESAIKQIDPTNENYQKMYEDIDPSDAASISRISDYLMQQYNEAADKDHKLNVRKSRRAAGLGAALGALVGSFSFTSTHEVPTERTVEMPNQAEHLDASGIKTPPGQLTGTSIDQIGQQHGFDGSKFVIEDPITHRQYTDMDYLFEFIREHKLNAGGPDPITGIKLPAMTAEDWWTAHNGFYNSSGEWLHGELFKSHSWAGIDPMANPGTNIIVNTLLKLQADASKHLVTVTEAVSETFRNVPATIGGWLTGLLLTGAATRQAAESVKQENISNPPPPPLEATPNVEPAPEANPPQQGAQPVTT